MGAGRAATTLLLGMGNPILSDDGVGVRLAAAVGLRLRERSDLDVIEECTAGGLELLDVLEGYDRVILFDALDGRGSAPGRRHWFTADSLRCTRHLMGVHDVNFATALELGRRTGLRLPPEHQVYICAVEVWETRVFSETMSPPLEQAFAGLAEAVAAEVVGLLEGAAPMGAGLSARWRRATP